MGSLYPILSIAFMIEGLSHSSLNNIGQKKIIKGIAELYKLVLKKQKCSRPHQNTYYEMSFLGLRSATNQTKRRIVRRFGKAGENTDRGAE